MVENMSFFICEVEYTFAKIPLDFSNFQLSKNKTELSKKIMPLLPRTY